MHLKSDRKWFLNYHPFLYNFNMKFHLSSVHYTCKDIITEFFYTFVHKTPSCIQKGWLCELKGPMWQFKECARGHLLEIKILNILYQQKKQTYVQIKYVISLIFVVWFQVVFEWSLRPFSTLLVISQYPEIGHSSSSL